MNSLDLNSLYFELRMARFEIHQILLALSGKEMEIRFLSNDERQLRAKEIRAQYFGVSEDALPQGVKDRLSILESPGCCAYEWKQVESHGMNNNT